MTTASLAGQTVLRADVHEPRSGCWHADVEADTAVDITGRQTLALAGETWSGTVLRGGVESGRWFGRLVGGAGGLATELEAKYYVTTPASTLLADLTADTGETLDAAILAAVLAWQSARWQRTQGRAADALSALVAAMSATYVWRLTRAGALWLGEDTYPDLTMAAVEVQRRPQFGDVLVAPTLAPTLRPGVTFAGARVDYVQTSWTAGRVRQRAWEVAP